ncbi:MAG: hypothetical protein AAF487_05180 [Bacteroidota bacterium]
MNVKRSTYVCILIFLSLGLSAQFGVDSHWHFGDSLSLDFQSNPLVLGTSSIQCPSNAEGATLSDENGNLLLYSDGNGIYNINGNSVANGVFTNSARENLIAPVPGQANRYYIFRSDAEFGVDYSIVDFNSNIEGEIAPTEKETPIQNFESELLLASHPNNIDYWLIVVHNHSGTFQELEINVYLVSSSGIVLNSEFSDNFFSIGWYAFVDDARISPNCDKIVTSHKGHNVTLFDFNNETGFIEDYFEQSAILPDNFSISQLNYIEFSSSGEYIYVLQDHYFVTRFEVLDNPIDFQNSGELIVWNDTMYWSHLKRGPDGRIYLINQETERIDYLSNTDELSAANVDFVEGAIEMPRQADFFPNSLSLCLSPQFISANNICENWTANLLASGFDFADSLFWDLEIPNSEDTLFFDLNEEIDGLVPGTYPVEFHYLADTTWFILYDTIEVFTQPLLDFGPDQTLCEGESLELIAGPPEYNYFWIDGSNEPSILVESPGLYAVMIANGPCAASDEIQIDYIYEPEVNLIDSVLCFEEAFVTLHAFDQHAEQYIWNTGESSDSLLVNEAGVFSVTLINDCFTVIDSAKIEYVLIPDLVDNLYEVCGQDSLLISSSYDAGNYSWSNGSEESSSLILSEGSFFVNVEDRGCQRSDLFEVNRIPFFELNTIVYPNVITPNFDQMNEVFRPFDLIDPQDDVCGYNTFKAETFVFDRWGLQLSDGSCSWDASEYSSGTYFYIANLTSQCLDKAQEQTRKGTFQIIR